MIQAHVRCIEVMELSSCETCSAPSLRGLSFLSMNLASALPEPGGRDLWQNADCRQGSREMEICKVSSLHMETGCLFFFFLFFPVKDHTDHPRWSCPWGDASINLDHKATVHTMTQRRGKVMTSDRAPWMVSHFCSLRTWALLTQNDLASQLRQWEKQKGSSLCVIGPT